MDVSELLEKHTTQHALVQRLTKFSYDELEFFIPQFVQLLVSFETDSMALNDFLLSYCSKYPHFSLIVFWQLQAFLFELRNDPESYSFQTVRKFINRLQSIIFNIGNESQDAIQFRENLHPALILCGSIASSFALPTINEYALPLVKSQGRQQKSFVFKLANFQKSLTRNLTLRNQRLSMESATSAVSDEDIPKSSQRSIHVEVNPEFSPRLVSKKHSFSMSSDDSETYITDDDEIRAVDITKSVPGKRSTFSEMEEEVSSISTRIKSKRSFPKSPATPKMLSVEFSSAADSPNLNSQSLPDLSKVRSRPDLNSTESETCLGLVTKLNDMGIRRSGSQKSSKRTPSYNELHKILLVNYAKKETKFIMSLQNISVRLSQVPKEARLSALRAELSIINEWLPSSEIDIPQLLPVTSHKNKRFHKILKLSINEACVLNSAERVPYLLLIEYLSDEIDFNPFTEYNQKIINNRLQDSKPKQSPKADDFVDLSDSVTDAANTMDISDTADESVSTPIEADLGDLPMAQTSPSSRQLVSENTNDLVDMHPEDQESSSNFNESRSANPIDSVVLADQMRIASVMLQQLQSSGQSNSEQFIAIRNRIINSMISLQDQFDYIDYEQLKKLKTDQQDAGQRKLENDFKIGEDWDEKKNRIRRSSAYGHLGNWDLCSVIVKNGDDLPQEAFACQLITLISNIWKKHGVRFWTKRMKILITSANAGLVETITNAMSIHSIKKSLTEISINEGMNSKGRIFTLKDYFQKLYGSEKSQKYIQAQENFARSLASYSIICYVLQIKDRHNGNIMLDHEGHIIHIDFGFLLSNSPGSVGFEAAPFKLTTEYIELLGGTDSKAYGIFVEVCKECFKALRKESQQLVSIVELMQKDSNLPCFRNGENTSILLEQRLQPNIKEDDLDSFVENSLVGKSIGIELVRYDYRTYERSK
ncbi:pik1 [[Candida] subhashii]|uniref:1-phosphatidylinositol 4-kinase n=1 Tax=[Candida] subhashii TaxID=561895 RepID=A0A8J5QKV9_9ASCO|nr:pik1 [[Candida] subhashii]KAG7660370.1 pik1 [[Candida] subhashii]